MAKKKDERELLELARERFKLCLEAELDDRDKSIEDQSFENGEQWSERDEASRVGRPCLTINKVSATTKQIIGDARQNRPAIKVRPVGGGAKKAVANIMTGLVRNIENISDAESVYDFGISSSSRGGWGCWRVVTEYESPDSFDQGIKIQRIVNPHSVYFDPNSTDQYHRDAEYCFVTEEIPKEQFENDYPKANISSWEDKTKQQWVNGKNVIIAEYFYKEYKTKTIHLLDDGSVVGDDEVQKDDLGKFAIIDNERVEVRRTRTARDVAIKWCKMSGEEKLESGEWAGKFFPVVECLGEEVWVNGKRERRSAIRFSKDSQRLYNWARSNSVETMALSPKQPFLLTADEIQGHEIQWQKANHTPQPYLLYNRVDGIQGRPQRQTGSFPDAGAIQEAMLASDDIKATTGTYDASVGARSNETSGKAIRERRIEGDTSTYEFHDNLSKAIKHTGRIIVDLIPHIYDTERTLRILGEDGREDIVTVNQAIESPGDDENPVMYDLRVGKYDVVVDVGPGFATKRQEATEGMIRTMEFFPQGAPILVPMIAKNSDWPDAEKVAEKLEQVAQGEPDPKEQIDTQKDILDVQGKELTNQKKQIDIQKATGEMQNMMAQVSQQTVLATLQRLGII